ncbi:hypothetical protein BBP40_006980 [Aspergillus hancockii]|nr:hypothetical protein BBP40_006980 [Aspergillus hancockii]
MGLWHALSEVALSRRVESTSIILDPPTLGDHAQIAFPNMKMRDITDPELLGYGVTSQLCFPNPGSAGKEDDTIAGRVAGRCLEANIELFKYCVHRTVSSVNV